MKPLPDRAGARGGPLVVIVLVLTAWVGARAVWWENPLAGNASGLPLPAIMLPVAGVPEEPGGVTPAAHGGVGSNRDDYALPGHAARTARAGGAAIMPSHQQRSRAAMRDPLPYRPDMGTAASAVFASPDRLEAADTPPPYLPAAPLTPPPTPTQARADRWSVDGWAFWRQGSDAAPISQGRVPIYGASQIGAVLNYRLAPSPRSNPGRDPRLYVRGYRALVRRGESELALGASARPVPAVPVRVAAEVRVTDGAFRSELRPSAYAVTELAPLELPLGGRLEAYAQGGWVGGTDATLFADGQASLTREVTAVAAASDNALRLSLGAGAWGGAQDGAERVDLGPTVRLDVKLGEIPARFAFDWRERVGGDAGPGSGAAVTLSTRF